MLKKSLRDDTLPLVIIRGKNGSFELVKLIQ